MPGTDWKEVSKGFRERLGQPVDHSPWSAAHQLAAVSKTERVKDLVDLAYMYLMSRSGESPDLRGQMVDVSAGTKWATRGGKVNTSRLPCICSTTEIYSFEHDRAFVAEDFGGSLGFFSPHTEAAVRQGCGAVSEFKLKKLFSNSMCVPHVATIMVAFLLGTTSGGCFRKK